MSTCQRCGGSFDCGMRDAPAPHEPCWCACLPALPGFAYIKEKDAPARQCVCPDCLRKLLKESGVSV